MRNYELMRNILVKTYFKGGDLELLEIISLSESNDREKIAELEEELNRLQEEGLILHNMKWTHGNFEGGNVKKLTSAGVEFARELKDDKVWFICLETLNNSKLDISYPLIKKVCERIIENIVMKSIPEEFRD
jgi:type IV secretory pathway TraG/TraD family ATPase VirD4